MQTELHPDPETRHRDIFVPPAPGAVLYRFEARLDPHVVGLTPGGLAFSTPFEGIIDEGLLSGGRVWGIDPFVLRSDGVGVIDAIKTLSLAELHVQEHVRGYCTPPAGVAMPPIATLLEPGFEWPDLDFPIRGFSTFRTGDPHYAALNRTLATVEGSANFATGALHITTRTL